MFQFCQECYNEYKNAPSWIGLLLQFFSAAVAAFALYVAWKNLRGLKRTQSLQAQMNLIQLENDVRKNYLQLKIANQKYVDETQKPNPQNLPMLSLEKSNAFQLYVTTADKLAALIRAKFLIGQFEGRNWKEEYDAFFKQVQEIHQTDDAFIIGKAEMIRNINNLLSEWNIQRTGASNTSS